MPTVGQSTAAATCIEPVVIPTKACARRASAPKAPTLVQPGNRNDRIVSTEAHDSLRHRRVSRRPAHEDARAKPFAERAARAPPNPRAARFDRREATALHGLRMMKRPEAALSSSASRSSPLRRHEAIPPVVRVATNRAGVIEQNLRPVGGDVAVFAAHDDPIGKAKRVDAARLPDAHRNCRPAAAMRAVRGVAHVTTHAS